MGRAAALTFAAQGAKVAIFDLKPEAGAEAVEEILRAGGRASHWTLDVTDTAAVDWAIEAAVKLHGPVASLFNVAGTVSMRAFHETTLEEFDHLFNVNVLSAFPVCRNVVRRMMETLG
jgi:NAD(P)-dependent dehydrogenase (short-subunit alcohol dehydrogenase family)